MTTAEGDSLDDLDLTLQCWQECEGALAALQGAIRRAREVYPGLSRVAREHAARQLAGLCRRTGLLVLRFGFPEYLSEGETK